MDKHIFVVHSGVTCISWLSICGHLGIAYKNTLVISSRGWSDVLMAWGVSLVTLPSIFGIRTRSNIFKFLSSLALFDKAISVATGGNKYHLYIPHSISPQYQLLSSHDLCSSFSYIEEGTLDYNKHYERFFIFDCEVFDDNIALTTDVILKYRNFLRRRGVDKYLPKITFAISNKFLSRRIGYTAPFDANAECAYRLFPESFQHADIKAIGVDPMWINDTDGSTYNSSIIVAFMPIYANSRICSIDYHIQAIMDVAKILHKLKKRRVLIKFHPDEDRKDSDLLLKRVFVQYGIELSIVPGDIPLEIIFKKSNVDLLHSMSSLGIYANKFNRRVYTYAPIIGELDKKFYEKSVRYKNNLAIVYDEVDVREMGGN